jgi:hypothetical protein
MRLPDSPDTLDAYEHGCGYESETNDDGRNRLRFSMTVRMVLIGRLDGEFEPKEHDRRADNIGEGFDSVRHESERVTEEASRTLEHGQR